jgi:hypothetical protein
MQSISDFITHVQETFFEGYTEWSESLSAVVLRVPVTWILRSLLLLRKNFLITL